MMGVGGWSVVWALHLDSPDSVIFWKPQKLQVLLIQAGEGVETFTVNETQPDKVCADMNVKRSKEEDSENRDPDSPGNVLVTL